MIHRLEWRLAVLAMVGAGLLKAQTANSSEAPLQPGLHLSAGDSSGSMLARAARLRGSVVISSEDDAEAAPLPVEGPMRYTIQEGDTLWDICERFFGDPYEWPRIWSYNHQITNPNWIFPGEVLTLSPDAPVQDLPAAPEAVSSDAAIVPAMKNGALLVRSRAFIDPDGLRRSGVLVGAHKEVMWLSQYDEAYVHFPDAAPKPGDRFSAFDVVEEMDVRGDDGESLGKLIEIKGLVKVSSFDRETKIARVVIDETIRPLPRGTLIGPVHQHFRVVPAVKNGKSVEGRLVAFLDPVPLAASHQIVFVDKGRRDGIVIGNRFFAVERRDGLRRINEEPDDMEGYPEEIIAEMRVIEAREKTSTCLITTAIRELEVGQAVEMRAGY